MKRRAKLVRGGHVVTRANGRTAKVTNVRRVVSEQLGELIEITLDSGEVLRRTPGAKLDVVRSR